MLAVLLLAADQVVAGDGLVALVWGEASPRSARNRLQVHVSELRAILGRDAVIRVGDALVRQRRPGLEERRLGALKELLDAELAAGRHAQIIDELRDTVTRHPLRERLAPRPMLALSRCARRSEALEVYSATRHRLVEELGSSRGAAGRRLVAAVLGAGVELERVGEHGGPRWARHELAGPGWLVLASGDDRAAVSRLVARIADPGDSPARSAAE